MNTENCKQCGKGFEKKNKRHKFCSNTCRTLNYRASKGIQEPEFLNGGTYTPKPKKKAHEPSISAVRAQELPKWQITPNDYQIAHLEYNLRYWQNVKENAMRNQIPLTYVGAGIGAIAGKDTGEKISYGLLGLIIGKILDGDEEKKRTAKQRTILRADEEIRSIRQQIRLEKEAKNAKSFLKNTGILLEEDKGVYTVSEDIVSKITAGDYLKEDIPSLKFKGSQWGYLLGNPGKNFYFLVHGEPGGGKTSFCLQFASYFSNNHGKVLYITREQKGQSKAFQDLIRRYYDNGLESVVIDRGSDKITGESLRQKAKDYDLVILDSISYMEGLNREDIMDLVTKDKKAVVGIMHRTKDGKMKGDSGFKYDCDTEIICEEFQVRTTEKSRYGTPNESIKKTNYRI